MHDDATRTGSTDSGLAGRFDAHRINHDVGKTFIYCMGIRWIDDVREPGFERGCAAQRVGFSHTHIHATERAQRQGSAEADGTAAHHQRTSFGGWTRRMPVCEHHRMPRCRQGFSQGGMGEIQIVRDVDQVTFGHDNFFSKRTRPGRH